jgi:hypothetical protein
MKAKIILTACVSLLIAGVAVWKLPAIAQRLSVDKENTKAQLLERINRSPDVPQRVVETDDTPLRITEAMVKVISGEEFTRTTGKTTDLISVSSVPNFSVLNVSDKVITGFMLMFRDPVRGGSRVIGFNRVKIEPGESYSVMRDTMVASPMTTVADDRGVRQQVGSKLEAANFWIGTGNHADSFITVGKVSFADGTTWMITEGGEIR